MEEISINPQEQEYKMAEVVSFIPRLISEKEWTLQEWRGYCMVKGLSVDTADRLAGGETNITLSTLAKVADVFGIYDIDKIVNISP
jgi:hypothetical protein